MKFKRPDEFEGRESKDVISARISADAKSTIAKAADKAKMSLSELVAAVLEDYAKFLKNK
jgi:uncharacterized protein (DUF1778 family)